MLANHNFTITALGFPSSHTERYTPLCAELQAYFFPTRRYRVILCRPTYLSSIRMSQPS